MKAAIALGLASCLALTYTVPTKSRSARTGSSHFGQKMIRDCYQSSYRYEQAQAYDDAVRALLLHYESRPQSYTVNLRLGWLYYLSGKYASSERHYQTAIKVAPDSLEAKIGYTLPLLAKARYREVEAVTKQILQTDRGNYFGNLRLAFALRMQKKYDPAAKVVERMVLLYPTDVSFLTELALLKSTQGDRRTARRVFEKVLTLDPENVTAKQWLGEL